MKRDKGRDRTEEEGGRESHCIMLQARANIPWKWEIFIVYSTPLKTSMIITETVKYYNIYVHPMLYSPGIVRFGHEPGQRITVCACVCACACVCGWVGVGVHNGMMSEWQPSE